MTNGKWQPPKASAPVVPTPQSSKNFTLEEAMSIAEKLLGQGKLQDAEVMLKKMLNFKPNFPPALYLLGIIAHQVGKADLAIKLIENAIEGDPENSLFHSNVGEMNRILKRLDKAIYHGKLATKNNSKFASAHCNLGIAYFDRGDNKSAERCQKKALKIDGQMLPALNNRGSIYREQKELEKAVHWYKKALSVNPNYLESLNNIGATLVDDNRAAEARPYLKKAVKLSPNYIEALNNLGRADLQLDAFDDALLAFQRAANLDQSHCSAHLGIAAVMQEKQNYKFALNAASHAVSVEPERAEAHVALGRAYVQLGEEKQAHNCFDKALKISPELGSAFNARGSLLLGQGKLEEAEENFRTGMALENEEGAKLESLFNLVSAIKIIEGSEEHLALIEAEKKIETLSEKKVMLLHFALGKMKDELKNHEVAFEHYITACAMKREKFDYSASAMTDIYHQTADVFNTTMIESLKQFADPSAKPIFVLGSPRSGTTLTEQIISTHPDVYGAGELKDFAGAIGSIPNTEKKIGVFPSIMKALSPDQISHIPKKYIKLITERAPDAKRITDKMPANYFYVGLIHALLPNAKIVHVKRNALDTCISCFQRLFSHNQYHSYNLSELGTYYKDYVQLMDHWKKVLPKNSFYEIHYEKLIENPEEQAKALLAACGLEWHDDCLDFHKNKRSIRTASLTQVRQPIYKTSVEKWRRYEKHLSPLIKALGDAAPDTGPSKN